MISMMFPQVSLAQQSDPSEYSTIEDFPPGLIQSYELSKDVFGEQAQTLIPAAVVDGHLVSNTKGSAALPSGDIANFYVAHASRVETEIKDEMLDAMTSDRPDIVESAEFADVVATNAARSVSMFAVRLLVDTGADKSLVDGVAVEYADETDQTSKTVVIIGESLPSEQWQFIETVDDALARTMKTGSTPLGGLQISEYASEWNSAVFLKGEQIDHLTGIVTWNDTPPVLAASSWRCAWLAARWSFIATACIACAATCPSAGIGCFCITSTCCSTVTSFIVLLDRCGDTEIPGWLLGISELLDDACLFLPLRRVIFP